MYANRIRALIWVLVFTGITNGGSSGTTTTNGGSYVTIINGTPYNWTMTETYRNKVKGHIPNKPPGLEWQWDWPKEIKSGESHIAFFRWDFSKPVVAPKAKAEAHVTYKIEGTSQPHSVRIRVDYHDAMVYADFLDNLESLNNPKNSIISLGYSDAESYENYPGQLFILAGSEGSFISSNPPIGWMQATLPTIGNRTLRELVLPASHNSGMADITCERGGGAHLDQTQTLDIYEQLRAGVRVLDIRPSFWENYTLKNIGGLSKFLRKWLPHIQSWYDWLDAVHAEDIYKDPGGQVRCGNFRPNQLAIWIGATGMDIWLIVEQINRFNREYPGELIIVNFQYFDWLYELERMKLHRMTYWLQQVEHRQEVWLPDDGPGSDLTSYHLNSFIGDGKSSVIMLMPPWWFSLYEDTGCVGENGIIQNEDTRDFSFWYNRDPYYWTGVPGPGQAQDPKDPKGWNMKRPIDPPLMYPFNASTIPRKKETRIVLPDDPADVEHNKKHIPGKHFTGFFEHRRFQWHNEYSNKHDIGEMSAIQAQLLHLNRATPYDEPHMVKWFTTLNRFDTKLLMKGSSKFWRYWPFIQMKEFEDFQSVIGYGRKANARLYDWLWKWCTPATYPNAVQIDTFEDSSLTALVMAINLVYGGKYEEYTGLEPGTGKSGKSEEFILEVMKAESKIIDEVIFENTRKLEKADNQTFWEFTHDKNTQIGMAINPWWKMKGMAQYIWHRNHICLEDSTYGKICGGDD